MHLELLRVQIAGLAQLRRNPHYGHMLPPKFLTWHEDGLWVAQSLDLDVIGVGKSLDAAVEELRGNVDALLSLERGEDWV